MTHDLSHLSTRQLLARSSLGAHAWCGDCYHADLLHDSVRCFSDRCGCVELRRMTVAEYEKWKGIDHA
jgi:hypothetical protein